MIILVILLIGLFIRFVLSFNPGFTADIYTWYGWADRLVNLGFQKFYDPNIWTHYTPGYFYILWILGFIKKALHIFDPSLLLQLFKLPNNLADIATGFLIYKIIAKKSRWWGFLGLVFYVFNPSLIFNSSIWGQADSFLTLLMLTSFYLILEKKNIVLSSLFFSFSFLVKPQAIFLLPVILIILVKNYKFKAFFKYLLIFLGITFILALPFFPNDVLGLPKLIWQMGQDYKATTLNAFNFWGVFGNWQDDSALFLGLTKYIWGIVVYLGFLFLSLISLYFKKEKQKTDYYFAGVLCLLSFFLFPTRIHERYLLSVFPLLLILGILLRSFTVLLSYFLLGFVHFLNLFYVYNNYYPEHIKTSLFENGSGLGVMASVLTLIIFFILWLTYFEKFPKFLIKPAKTFNLSKFNFLSFKVINPKEIKVTGARWYLIIILMLALILRLWNIGHPKAYIFDEVYHGFTAQEMAKGNIKAWEWWNEPPKGFAYEWTHPPLAKLIMSLGVKIFNGYGKFDQYAFRFPAAFFGAGVILLTYLLGTAVFKNQRIGLLAAFLVSFDGLAFVMSRVGMADIYFVFFLLLTLYLTLKEKYLSAGIALGLSMATKWTGIYLYPVVGIILMTHWLNKTRRTNNQIIGLLGYWVIGFIVLPIVTYVLSYIPFFTSGHSFEQFKEVQRQMWWYHTNLKATHSYQSSAYTWPLMLRPVWFWVDYKDKTMANIYNLGNPMLWWTGLMLLPLAIYKIIKDFLDKNIECYKLGFILVCYFAFWLPWIFSPRIMYLHHYLPAIPFLCILIAYCLNKLLVSKSQLKFSLLASQSSIPRLLITSYLLLIVSCFFFFYPIYAGLPIPNNLLPYFFWLASWK